jgi:hypothetical protein
MGLATFWVIYFQAHLVTLVVYLVPRSLVAGNPTPRAATLEQTTPHEKIAKTIS